MTCRSRVSPEIAEVECSLSFDHLRHIFLFCCQILFLLIGFFLSAKSFGKEELRNAQLPFL
jgi:hypothetical protein